MGIVYSALREKDEIRLLRLLPGTGSEPVKCTIFHARLGSSPTYDALSYMWGADQPGKGVLLRVDDGRTMEVRENLGNALRYLRLKDQERVLWVDAICINQEDDTERGHQVAQMGMIYSQATTVRVWLGLSDEFSMKAFRFLNNAENIRKVKEGILALNDFAAVARLCMREYWQRLWIIQEIVLAARIDVHCGEQVLGWEESFSPALFAFEERLRRFDNSNMPRHASDAVLGRIVGSAAMKICRQRKANTESGPAIELASLLSLLWTHKDAKCADVRDKIFGTHSFAPECCRTCIPVDYTCSAYTLCRRVLEHDILCHSDGRRNGGREGVVRRSLDLHGLIVNGALEQAYSKNHFGVGNPAEVEELDTVVLKSQIPSPIMILGHQTGQVAFVTPPLKSLFIEEEILMVPRAMIEAFKETKFGCEDVDYPVLTSQITKALGKIWRSKEMDIISGQTTKWFGSMEMVDIHCPNLNGDTAVYGLRTFVNFCSEFLRTSAFLRSNPGHEDCVIYLAKTGLSWTIAIAPVGTTPGDSVCTFKDTNVIAIVRKIEGDNTMVGQGSSIDENASDPMAPQIGNVVNLQLDLSTLQMFSKMTPRCESEDYRVVLTIPPRPADIRPHRVRSGRYLNQRLRNERTENLVTPPYRYDDSQRWLDDGQKLPKYTKTLETPLISDTSDAQQPRPIFPVGMYYCRRCDMTFENSRDNLRHAATWSHQQCNECKRWTSWQPNSKGSTTSSTPFCTRCRIDDPSCAVDLSEPCQMEARTSWWKKDAMSQSSDDSVRDSMAFSEDMSSSATTVSDSSHIGFVDTDSILPGSKMPYSHTRKHFCDHNCKLFPYHRNGKTQTGTQVPRDPH